MNARFCNKNDIDTLAKAHVEVEKAKKKQKKLFRRQVNPCGKCISIWPFCTRIIFYNKTPGIENKNSAVEDAILECLLLFACPVATALEFDLDFCVFVLNTNVRSFSLLHMPFVLPFLVCCLAFCVSFSCYAFHVCLYVGFFALLFSVVSDIGYAAFTFAHV